MGAYRDKRSGRWRYRKWIMLPSGKRERIAGTPAVDTKKAAEHAEAMHVLRVMNPGMVPEPKVPAVVAEREEVPTVQKYSETFLESYVPTIHKVSAQRSLRQILKGQILPAFGALRLDEIRQSHIDSFVAAEKRRGRAIKTINNRLSALSSLVKYAVANGVIAEPKPPLKCKISGGSAEVIAVPMEDVERLLDAAEDDRWRVAVLLATEAGLRAGEIRGLQWGDIKDGQLTIRRALDKQTGEAVAPKHDKVRTVPLSPRLAEALEALPRRGLWVVPADDGQALPYSPGLLTAIAVIYERAGVARPSNPIHCLRHAFGTEMAARAVPLPVLQELMGHADIKTTRRYVHVSEKQKRDAIAAVWATGGQQRQRRKWPAL